uniref:starch synthase n=1 Tax=Canna indica TaxID=4628 RepID=A0A7H0TIZ3_9LILI|nr:soluble starch synthase [Canna indica]
MATIRSYLTPLAAAKPKAASGWPARRRVHSVSRLPLRSYGSLVAKRRCFAEKSWSEEHGQSSLAFGKAVDPESSAAEEEAILDPAVLALGRTHQSEEELEELNSVLQENNELDGNGLRSLSGVELDAIVEEIVESRNLPDENVEENEGDQEGLVSKGLLDVVEEEEETDKQERPRASTTRNIVFVSSEAAPYSKTGGLGDVCGSLPIAFAARGHRVMVVSPRYLNGVSDKKFVNATDVGVRIKICCFGVETEVAFFHEFRAGVDWVFVDHPSYHRPGNPYGDSHGAFADNQFRFTLLSYAACEAPLVLPLGGYTYGEKCLFLVNDWHASLVSVLIAAKYRPHGVYNDARSILVIHNLAHQGIAPASTYGNLGLPSEWYGALEWIFPPWSRMHALDNGEVVNFLKGAVVTSDRIMTVSQGYSWEITTVEGGQGLNELLSSRKFALNGILNFKNISAINWF